MRQDLRFGDPFGTDLRLKMSETQILRFAQDNEFRAPCSVKKMTHCGVSRWVLIALLVTHPLPAQSRTVPAERFPAELDRYIANVLSQWQIPGLAIAVVRNDSTLVAKGYGVRALGKPERVDENTVFDIASLTKSFTATAAAMLVDRGILRWDDPARRHLPSLVLPTDSLTERATLRDFLAHRTGLDPANSMWVLTAVNRDEVLRRMRYLRVVAPFRQTMVYSNIGVTVAGEAAAAAAHMPFESLLRDVVIKPLRLASTTWTYQQTATMPNVAAAHATIAGRQQVIPRELQRQSVAPAAAVQSSASDMTRWMRLHLNNGVLDGKRYVSDSTMREMHSVQVGIAPTPAMRAARLVRDSVTGYGMGWQIMDYRGHRVLWHSGNGNGQIAYMALFPTERLGIVVMVNTWSAPLVHAALINRIADTYLGYSPRDWAAEEFARLPAQDSARAANKRAMIAMGASAPPAPPLGPYAAQYEHPLFGPVWIRLADRGLTLQMGDGQVADLEYHGNDAFYVAWRDPFFREFYGGEHVTFTTSGDSIVSFTTLMNRDQFTARRAGASP
jgi:CubicO group peptidase (beta-lactamase class C family)